MMNGAEFVRVILGVESRVAPTSLAMAVATEMGAGPKGIPTFEDVDACGFAVVPAPIASMHTAPSGGLSEPLAKVDQIDPPQTELVHPPIVSMQSAPWTLHLTGDDDFEAMRGITSKHRGTRPLQVMVHLDDGAQVDLASRAMVSGSAEMVEELEVMRAEAWYAARITAWREDE